MKINYEDLKGLINKIANQENCESCCWNGGEYNVRIDMINEDVYELKLKSFETAKFEIFVKKLKESLSSRGYSNYIIEKYREFYQKDEPVHCFRIYSSKNIRRKSIKEDKGKFIIKNSILGNGNIVDNSKKINISTNFNLR